MKIEDYNEYYIQGSDQYLIPKDIFVELFNEMINWKEESKMQKEAIDKAAEYIIKEKNNYLYHVQKVLGKCIDNKGNINSNTAGLLLSAAVNTCDCTLNILNEVSE